MIQCGSNFLVCGSNHAVLPFFEKLLNSTFMWCCMFCDTVGSKVLVCGSNHAVLPFFGKHVTVLSCFAVCFVIQNGTSIFFAVYAYDAQILSNIAYRYNLPYASSCPLFYTQSSDESDDLGLTTQPEKPENTQQAEQTDADSGQEQSSTSNQRYQ